MEQHPIPRLGEIQKPKLVSFGPIYHNPQLLARGECYKKFWAKAHASEDSNHETGEDASEDSNREIGENACEDSNHETGEDASEDSNHVTGEELLLLQKIKDHIMELKELYTEDVIRGKTDDELASILFVDGCAELYFLKNAEIDHPEKLDIEVDQMLLVQQDLLLSGNQVPYKVLELLSKDSSQLMQSVEKLSKMLRDTEKVMELKDRYLPKIQTAKEKLAGQPKKSRPKIQKVQQTLLGDHGQFEIYYKPKVVSFGPIHHRPALGESLKFMWAAAYMAKIGRGEDEVRLCQKIANNITQLKEFYTDDAIEGCSDEELAWMLFVDGCAMLYFLKAFTDAHFTNFETDAHFTNFETDAHFTNFEISHLNLIVRDLLLLENQLPYELLKLLTKRERYRWLKECMDCFYNFVNPYERLKKARPPRVLYRYFDCGAQRRSRVKHLFHKLKLLFHKLNLLFHRVKDPIRTVEDDPIHLLDYIRKCILATHSLQNNDPKSKIQNLKKESSSDQYSDPEIGWAMNRNIQNLKEAGILQVKRDEDATIFDISFQPHFFAGYLHLPPLIVNNSMETMFHNLKAYELCPDFDNEFEICAFVMLFSSLLKCEEDVKELRSTHILLNCIGSDTEVVELFRNLGRSPIGANAKLYSSVQVTMNKYFKSRRKTWLAEGYYTYFRSPWTIMACIAAGLGLLLTLIQTLQGFNSRSG